MTPNFSWHRRHFGSNGANTLSVANGKVFVASYKELVILGVKPSSSHVKKAEAWEVVFSRRRLWTYCFAIARSAAQTFCGGRG